MVNKINNLLQQVTDKQAESPAIQFLTAYIQFNHNSQSDPSIQANSLLHELLEEKNLDLNEVEKKQLQNTLLSFTNNKKQSKGIAIFLKLNFDNPTNIVEEKQAIELNFKPQNKIILAKTYDFIQLLVHKEDTNKLLIVHIQRDNAIIYIKDSQNLEKYKDIDNKAIYSDNKEAAQIFSPKKGMSTQYYAANNKVERSDKSADHQFIKSLIDESKSHANKNDIEEVVFYLSTHFHEWDKEILDSFESNILNAKIIKENPATKSSIMDDFQNEEVNLIVETPRAEDPSYKSGWDESNDAVKEGRCKTLYLPINANKTGYVIIDNNNIHAYPYAVDNSFKTENLELWMSLNAYQQGSEVKLIDTDAPMVSLRY